MKTIMRPRSCAVLILLLCACGASAQPAKDLPNDIKWLTTSVEYAAVCEQTYRSQSPHRVNV